MYSIYSVDSVYNVYRVYSVYSVYSMYSMYSMYSVSTVQCVNVLLSRPLGHHLRLGPQVIQGTVIKAVHCIPEIEGPIEL